MERIETVGTIVLFEGTLDNSLERFSLFWQNLVESNYAAVESKMEDLSDEKKHNVSRGLEYYQRCLPVYREFPFSKSFVGVVNGVCTRPARVLDLGCGAGVALGKLKMYFGDKIETWGLSASDLKTPQTASGIDHYIIGDAHRINFPQNYFDAIIAYQSYRYFADPLFVLERSYEWLSFGGYGFIDSLAPFQRGIELYRNGERVTTKQLALLFNSLGYSFQNNIVYRSKDEYQVPRDNLSFKKNNKKPHFNLPVSNISVFIDDYFLPRLVYSWNKP